MICFAVEVMGLLLVGMRDAADGKVGTFLAGAGFSLVFPALGVVAVKAVPQQNQGGAGDLYRLWIYRWASPGRWPG
jgi:hypothetical protein